MKRKRTVIDHLQIVNYLSPLQVSTWRTLLVTLLLALYLLVHRPHVLALQKREIGYYVIYGVIGIGLFNLAFNTSVAVNKASVATALMFCAPVFVALWSWWIFHERLRPLQLLAMVVNLLGFALVGTGSALLAGTAGNVSGLLLGLFSQVCFALYTLLGRGSARKPGQSDRDPLLHLPVRHACPGPVGSHFNVVMHSWVAVSPNCR